MQAREALERRRRRQARDGLPLEPSPVTPDDDDDDDDKDDDMAAQLGLSPDPRLGHRSPSPHPGGLAPPTFGAGTLGSLFEERRRAEGVLDPLAKIIGVTPGGQAEPHVPQEQVPAPAVQEVGPSVVVRSPGGLPPWRLGHPRWKRRRSWLRGNLQQRLRRPRPEGSPRRHDWPCPEWVGICGYLCFSFFVVCLELAFSLFQQAEAGLGWSGPHEGP
jgi:hypothetical protein